MLVALASRQGQLQQGSLPSEVVQELVLVLVALVAALESRQARAQALAQVWVPPEDINETKHELEIYTEQQEGSAPL